MNSKYTKDVLQPVPQMNDVDKAWVNSAEYRAFNSADQTEYDFQKTVKLARVNFPTHNVSVDANGYLVLESKK